MIRVRYEEFTECPSCGGELHDGPSINESNLGNGYKRWQRWQWCKCGWFRGGVAITPGLAEILRLKPHIVVRPLSECPYN